MTNINFLPKEIIIGQKLVNRVWRNFRKNKNLNTAFAFMFIGTISLGLIQGSIDIEGRALTSRVQAQSAHLTDMDDILYGANYSNRAEIDAMFEKQVKLVASRPSFLASLEVVKKHEQAIRSQAQAFGIPENVAIGIAFLENGGSEYAKSSAGAAGIYQLMPGTAQDLGLTVNRYQDDRRDPNKSIQAGLTYLKNNYRLFGDWGLATWSYHAGEGNVSKALKIYARANYGVELPGFNQSQVWTQFVSDNKITVHKLLSDPSVQTQLTSRLKDDSAGYPYKVMATAHLFELNNKMGQAEFMQKVVLLNTEAIRVADLF